MIGGSQRKAIHRQMNAGDRLRATVNQIAEENHMADQSGSRGLGDRGEGHFEQISLTVDVADRKYLGATGQRTGQIAPR